MIATADNTVYILHGYVTTHDSNCDTVYAISGFLDRKPGGAKPEVFAFPGKFLMEFIEEPEKLLNFEHSDYGRRYIQRNNVAQARSGRYSYLDK